LDSRDFETIESRVEEAEQMLNSKRSLLEDSELVRDPKRLASSYREIEEAQITLDALYARWAELEAKIS
jgi:ATP-binding cassette subfamily F protein uup